MNTEEIKTLIRANAAEVARLHARIHETYVYRDHSDIQHEQWKAACAEFHARYNTLAFPGGYDGVLDRISSGEEFAVEAALCFLECRPYFFRSGYMYKDILQRLRRAPLSPAHAMRLQRMVDKYQEWKTNRRRGAASQ